MSFQDFKKLIKENVYEFYQKNLISDENKEEMAKKLYWQFLSALQSRGFSLLQASMLIMRAIIEIEKEKR